MGKDRKYGILMPISSLPSAEGIGTLGRGAYGFIDYIHSVGASVWQVLPLNPTNYGDSPYQSCSSDALNYYFIDLEELVEEGLLKKEEIDLELLLGTERRVDYGKQFYNKTALLKKAYGRFKGGKAFRDFVEKGEYADFAVFMALKTKFGHVAWTEWEEPYREFDGQTVASFVKENKDEVLFWHFTQYKFLQQWNALKEYANRNGVAIMGDIPLYVAYDSVEVWKYGDKLFKMDEKRTPVGVAGCPPDGFTEDGQLWGNPVYDWPKMRGDNFKWWNERISRCFKLFDSLRIDHFRGFDRYYEVPLGETTARNGKWFDGPKEDLFADKLDLNIVAEDLGVIDDGVRRLMKNVGYPGMKVLEFAFDGMGYNEHKPSNYTENFVCYTGTHDNMPIRQYIEDLDENALQVYRKDLSEQCAMLGFEADLTSAETMCRSVVELAFKSKADTAIIPFWDLKAMGGEARINLPSTVSDKNWSWRFIEEDFDGQTHEFLGRIASESGRV
ncbi:MAG: 4-alpha-glucanotransferase [Clostridia bacterium]|nr:4-alpha-glucanotransferase [Clostridia bacterium]